MSERRRGLGKGLGALIPTSASGANRPVDVFFPSQHNVPDDVRDQETGVAESPSQDAAKPGKSTEEPKSTKRTTNDVQPESGLLNDAELVAVPGATFAEVPVGAIAPNPKQPRTVFDEDDLEELAASIREVGVLQPVVVRAAGTDEDGANRYELIMGERRWRASQRAGAERVPAIIRQTEAEDLLRDALLENLHRAQLNPLEEAAAYQQLLDDFDCTHEELATRIARSRPQISNTLRLLKLPPLVQRRVAAGVLSAGHARALLGLTDGAAMERMAQRIVAEGLSVRATEELITLGEDPMQPEMRRRPRAGEHSEALDELATRMSDRLDTKVKVALGQRKGRISIEFASVADLNRILGVLNPTDPGVLSQERE